MIRATKKYGYRLWLAGFLLAGTCFAQTWGSASAGYIYQATETPTGHWVSFHGWYGLGTYNITDRVSLFGDFPNFYAAGQNLHVQLYGVSYSFTNKTRYTPFVFIGPGFIRSSNAGAVNYSFAWCVGGGLLIRLTRWVSFQTIPVEYVMNTANWNVGNNFDARAGFTLTIPKSH